MSGSTGREEGGGEHVAAGPTGYVNVVVVDDHPVVREGLRSVLSLDREIRVVGSAGDGEAALGLIARLRPHLVVMDIRMPRMDGIAATRIIVKDFPDTKVILLTGYDDQAMLRSAVASGASALLMKDASVDLLLYTVRTVLHDGVVVKREVFQQVVATVVEGGEPAVRPSEQPESGILTPREREVLDRMARGLRNKEIARELSLAEVTVKKHVQSILGKLGAQDRAQAVLVALRLGLIR